MNKVTVTDFINTRYREYWSYSNKNGKNSVDPREQLPEVVRKIIYASYVLNIREHKEHKTTEVMGEVAKYHGHGTQPIEDSIKGVATGYKSQPATRILEGIGNFGSAPGDDGAAGRYTSVSGTPLLSAIYKDIQFMPFSTEDTGLNQPVYISAPLPFALINGMSSIGTGKSCYIAERDARKVIEWIDKLRSNDWHSIDPPDAMSVTGCETWFNHDNGYIYYDAVVHYGVNIDNLDKKGAYDVITALPPQKTPDMVIAKMRSKMPTRITSKILDGSGKGRPTYIVLPKGYLSPDDFMKYGLQYARKENILIWEEDKDTMKIGSLYQIAKEWFDDRCTVVTKRLNSQIDALQTNIKKIDLIKEFATHGMINWKSQEVVDHFVKLNPDTGEDDAALVLAQSAKTFLPENLSKNEILRGKNEKEIKALKKQIANIGDFIIKEAYEIIDAQEAFFKE